MTPAKIYSRTLNQLSRRRVPAEYFPLSLSWHTIASLQISPGALGCSQAPSDVTGFQFHPPLVSLSPATTQSCAPSTLQLKRSFHKPPCCRASSRKPFKTVGFATGNEEHSRSCTPRFQLVLTSASVSTLPSRPSSYTSSASALSLECSFCQFCSPFQLSGCLQVSSSFPDAQWRIGSPSDPVNPRNCPALIPT